MSQLRNSIQQFLPKGIKHSIKKYICKLSPSTTTFSLAGEDRILNYLFLRQTSGFYVDIGAFDPIDCSNTYLFYEKGWRGINIDARPGSMKEFEKLRPRDINLEAAIANREDSLTYYQMAESVNTMNTFSKDFLEELGMEDSIVNEIKIKTSKLSTILDQYLPKSTPIDFMSVDVEGMDLEVLKSNNWALYRPKVVLVESLAKKLEELAESDLVKFMISNGYECFAKTPNGLFFLENNVQLHPVNLILN